MNDSTVPPSEKAALRQREIDTQLTALHMPIASSRITAIKRLGELQAEIDVLIQTLHDSHETVRAAAAAALGNFSGNEREPEIVDILLAAIDDPSEKVCQTAIRSLGRLHAQAARSELETFLDDPNPYIAGAAILALARLGTSDLAAAFTGFLHHPNIYIQTQAARAVGLVNYTQAGSEILQMLILNREKRLDSASLDAEGRANRREIDLYSLLTHLIQTSGELKITEAVPTLIEIAQKDIGLRGLAIEALIAIGAEVDAELLTGLLADPSVYLRRRLILLIIQQNYRRALPQLRPLLRDVNISIRGAALQAVLQMQDHDALGQIRWMAAHDSNPFIRIQAVEAMAILMGREAAIHLLALTNDSNFQVRRATIRHLLEWEIQDTAVLTSLARFAQSFPEEELTAQIYKALQQYGFDLAYAEQAPNRTANHLLPDELLSDVPKLIKQLERWQKSLRQGGSLGQDPEAERTDKALTYLIDLLKRQGLSSVLDQ